MLYEDGVIVTVTMSTEDHMALTEIADHQGETFAWILLQAVRQYIDRAERVGHLDLADGRVVRFERRRVSGGSHEAS